MKRHLALQDLSRDHFHVLFRCQRLRRALPSSPWNELRALVDEFLAFFESDMSPHFREEDDLVLPRAEGHETLRALADRTLREHVLLRSEIDGLRRARASEPECRRILARLEPLITDHVQMEERELFEGLQEAATPQEMAQLAAASLEFRRQHRAPDAIGPRPGRG